MGENHRATYVFIFVAGHPLPYNKGPVSMTWTEGVDVTGVMQKISGDTISTHSSTWYGMIPNLPDCFESLGGILQ